MAEFIESTHDMNEKSHADLETLKIGYEKCAPSHAFGPVIRPYSLIHFVMRGEGKLEVAGNSFSLSGGDAFLIPENKVSWYQASAYSPWEYVWIGFLGTRSESYFQRILSAVPEHYVIRGLDCNKYERILRPVSDLTKTCASSYFRANAALYQVLGLLAEDLGLASLEQTSLTLAGDVRLYLDMKYAEKLVLEEVADEFHIHPNHLTRIFREEFGISPKQYLMRLKMEKASELLRSTTMQVSTIGMSLGYEDQLVFSKAFRNYTGLSPMAYRKAAALKSAGKKEDIPV